MIHKFKLNGYNIVLDVNSGTVHVLDDPGYDLLDYGSESMTDELPEAALRDLGGRYEEKELRETWEDLYNLCKEKLLFSEDVYKKYRNVGDKAPIKSMCLNVAHDCNLRCKYCFASTGDFGGGRKLMPLETGKAAIDFLLSNSGSRKHLEVDFFGGEPLMNFDMVKALVSYARAEEKKLGKEIRFTITTNAMLLNDEAISFINREMSNVVLSIDGRKKINDRMRVRTDGTGSYDAILPKIKKLVDDRGDKEYYVRGTFTRDNLDFSQDVLSLADEGFTQISVEPVLTESEKPYSLREEDLPQIFKEYEKLALDYLKRKKDGRGFNFFHFMIDLNDGPCLIKLLRGCGCGNEYVAVTPDGDIYPCHQYVGRPEFIMGNVHTGGIVRPDLRETFSNANIFTKKGCGDCWARFFCSGGCNANNSLYTGSMLNPFTISCKMEKKRLECALMIKAALA